MLLISEGYVLKVQRNSERYQGKSNKLFLWVNLCTGYCDNNNVVVTFWKFVKVLVRNWEMKLT